MWSGQYPPNAQGIEFKTEVKELAEGREEKIHKTQRRLFSFEELTLEYKTMLFVWGVGVGGHLIEGAASYCYCVDEAMSMH